MSGTTSGRRCERSLRSRARDGGTCDHSVGEGMVRAWFQLQLGGRCAARVHRRRSRLKRWRALLRCRFRSCGVCWAVFCGGVDATQPAAAGAARGFSWPNARALSTRWCPPTAARLVSSESPQCMRSAAAGVSGWAARRVGDEFTAACRAAVAVEAPSADAVLHPHCPTVLLAACVSDPHPRTRCAVACNPGCGQDVLRVLAADTDPEVRRRVAAAPELRRRQSQNTRW